MKTVALIWQSYQTNEYIPIGILKQVEKKYVFKYSDSALVAKQLGCFLPFPYTDEARVFDTLPTFFTQRMINSDFQRHTFDIDIPKESTMEVLTYLNSKKNNDNFLIVDASLIKTDSEEQLLKKTP